MAKIDRSRHRSAVYNTSVGASVSGYNSFSIKAKGYSWTFSHNWDNWGKYVKATKKRLTTILAKRLAELSQFIAVEAMKRCPHFSGNLERSITVSEPEKTALTARGRIEFAIGVLSSWRSDYDKQVVQELKKIKYYPAYSGPELALHLHEMYDTFIGKTVYGYDRMQRKSDYFGVKVGSHFLTRAYTENREYIRRLISSRLSPDASTSVQGISPSALDSINTFLQQSAVNYTPKGTS